MPSDTPTLYLQLVTKQGTVVRHVPVEPVGSLTSTAGSTGRITYNVVVTDGLVLPEGEYLIVPWWADGEWAREVTDE